MVEFLRVPRSIIAAELFLSGFTILIGVLFLFFVLGLCFFEGNAVDGLVGDLFVIHGRLFLFIIFFFFNSCSFYYSAVVILSFLSDFDIGVPTLLTSILINSSRSINYLCDGVCIGEISVSTLSLFYFDFTVTFDFIVEKVALIALIFSFLSSVSVNLLSVSSYS